MFHPEVVAARQHQLESAFKADLPGGRLRRHPIDLCWAMRKHLEDAADAKGNLLRPLTQEETQFIQNETLLSTVDFRYWAERYCNPPEAPIWMGDLSFRPIGDVRVGDEVIGWDRLPLLNRNKHPERPAPRRKCVLRESLVRTRVLALSRRRAAVVKVYLASGRTLRCTPDHRWSEGVPQYRLYRPWTTAVPGAVLSRIIDPVSLPDTPDLQRLAAWLGGIYDGEGSHRYISQYIRANPLVFARIHYALETLGIPFSHARDVTAAEKGFHLTGGRQGLLKFLLSTTPVKRHALERQILGSTDRQRDVVVAVEPDGEDEVVGLQTTTGNYVVWGYASKNCMIAKESQDLEPITPMWKSQEIMLRHFGNAEKARVDDGHPDGLLFLILKARQLGASTLTEAILAHRVTTQKSMRGLVAGDVQEQSQYMFGMAELVVSNLPWWLRPPPVAPTTRGHHMSFATGARLSAFWGKSSRGGLQDDAKVKGNLGRGKTFNTVHLSELSTWENPKQIEDGLLPGVPRRARTFVILESTAKGRHDWWHSQWDQAGRGVGRFNQIFIPWYIEPDKYWLPVPEGWEPLPSTKQHAEEVERDSPNWCFGETVRLPKEQLYWYEKERQRFDDSERGVEFDASGHRIPTFLEEYPASPRDAFQNAGKSVFSQKALERMRTYERPPVGICDIAPAKDIALLQAWERDAAAKQALEDAKPRPYSQQGL